MKIPQFIFALMLFSQISFSQDSTTIQNIDKKLIIQKLPAVLERKELLQNINYPRDSYKNEQMKQPGLNTKICLYCGGEPPLIIVDGKEMLRDGMKNIDPKSIDLITVLKDVNSAKQYGDKGKNGVILITMKKK